MRTRVSAPHTMRFLTAIALGLSAGSVTAQSVALDALVNCTGADCPGAPSGSAGPGSADGQITLSWEPATGGAAVVSWTVYALVVPGWTGEVVSHLPAAQRSHVFDGLDVSQTYAVGVEAFTAGGFTNSAWALGVSAGGTPPPGVGGGPPPPDGGGGSPRPETEPDPDPPRPVLSPTAAFGVDAPCADGLCRVRTGQDVTFTDTSSGTVARRSWDFDAAAGRARSAATTRHAWSSPGFYGVTLTVKGADRESTASRVFLVEAATPAGTCEPDGETICLQDSRYQVRATWSSPDGEVQAARAAHAGTNDSGLLWFHEAENWEALVKVLDGCSVNGADWVFAASATTLGFDIEVTDTVTGEVREYGNEAGRQADAVADTGAFTDRCVNHGTHRASSTAVEAGAATSPVLLLNEARFEVTVEWSTADGRRGEARSARAGTASSGLFWFFEPDNWEMLIKVLDGCGFNGHYWVYAASATDVGLDIAVTDTTTGEVRRYAKSPGAPTPAMTDAAAFADSCRSD